MKQNMGFLDRFIRLTIALFLGAVYFISDVSGGWAIALVCIISVLAVTVVTGICPFYYPFKIDTHSKQEKHSAGNL